jgi:hypothetical protein
MRKRLIIVFALLVGALLAGCLPGKSVCDNREDRQSDLCDTADKYGVKLENVGFGLRLASTGAMAAGVYDREDVVKVLKDLLRLLENPVSEVLFRLKVEEALEEFPGMFSETKYILESFTSGRDMHVMDRQIMIKYCVDRLAVLEPG